MGKNTITALLTDLRALILSSRPAYRDFLGEATETKTTKILENVVLAESQMVLSAADAAFSGFIFGEAYRVVLNGEEKSVVAKDFNDVVVLSNVEDFLNPPNDYWALRFDSEAGKMIASTSGAFLGATISMYHDGTVTTQKWSVKKLAYELLPDRLLSALSAAANTARKALTAANAAQSTANTAQSTANTAASVANGIVMAASSQGVVNAKTITDIGDIGDIGGPGVTKRYTAKGLNIKVGSFVTVTESTFGTVSMRWDGHSAAAKFPGSGPTIYLDYQLGTDTYTLRTSKNILLTIEKMEYTEVPLSAYGTVALPYLQFPHILLYSNSGTGKLFEITVDDSGTLSATGVTDTTT